MAKLRGRRGLIASVTGLAVALTTGTTLVVTSGEANAASSRCGAGYTADGTATAKDTKGKVLGTLQVAWNAKLKDNCAVFVRKDKGGKPRIGIRIYDATGKAGSAVAGKPMVDGGPYRTFAGPVYAHSPGCLTFDFGVEPTIVTGVTFPGRWGCPGTKAPKAGAATGSTGTKTAKKANASTGGPGSSTAGASPVAAGSTKGTPVAALPSSSGDGRVAPLAGGWKLVLNEQFDRLDTNTWEVYDGPGNAGIGLRRPSQVKVEGGHLVITAKGMTSGGIGLKTNQLYGRWEFRARTSESEGSWSNILLWPDNGQGELDMAEDSTTGGSNLFLHPKPGGQDVSEHFAGDFSKWHTWTFEWLPTGITEWIDGKQVYHANPAGFTNPAGLAIQLDIDDGSLGVAKHAPSASSVSTFTVDWIKQYARA